MTLVVADRLRSLRSGNVLVDGVSLGVEPGEFLGIVGPNGAGKSTLLRLLAGDIRPDEGAVTIGGVGVAEATLGRLARLRSFVGPQSVSDVVFTAGEVVAMGRYPESAEPEDQEIIAAMELVDVAQLSSRVMRTLSSGEQQRVHLARAIAQAAPLILLDEPTSALDVGHQEMVMTMLRSFVTGGGAVVAVLHDLNLAAAYADSLLLLADGQVVASGTPRDVLRGPRLTDAYGEPMEVIDHPYRDCPLVLTTRQ